MERDLSEYLDKVDAAEAENLESVYLYDKAYEEGFADGYKQAIDEFLKRCKERVEKTKIARLELFEICEIAEELKTVRGSE